MERYAAFWLASQEYIGPVKGNMLLKEAGSYEGVMNIKETVLEKISFLDEKEKSTFLDNRKNMYKYRNNYEEMLSSGVKMIIQSDLDYPERLTNIYDPPLALFVKGKLPKNQTKAVAIIGARNCSEYGKMLSEKYGRVLGSYGISIISGMAYGIDSASHRGALKASGETFAVLGCGPDICYPPANIDLYMDIQENGGIISEYPPGVPAIKWHFPQRNRLISGLSDVVLIIEAREKSGSLITADMALAQGRDVFAVPGRPDETLYKGCNSLLEQGAGLALSPDTLLCYFGINKSENEKNVVKKINTLENNEKIVYSVLDFKQRSAEEIIARTMLSFGECMEALFGLEEKGYIIQPANHYYIRKME